MKYYACETPVALFIFNRPDLTDIVFSEIRKVRPTKLLIIADGPRIGNSEDEENCKKTKKITNSIDWPCHVEKNFSDVNMGCKSRISTGIDWVFDQVESAIFLEDDCLPSPDFFKFCERMLSSYYKNPRVMMIGGANYMLGNLKIEHSYYFSRYFSIWGWATWRRAWKSYDIKMSNWTHLKKTNQINLYYKNSLMKQHLVKMFDMAYSNQINTWDIQWFYSCLFTNGVAIYPANNLVSNIGVEGTHTNGVEKNHLQKIEKVDWDNFKDPIFVNQNHIVDENIYNSIIKTSFIKRLGYKIRNILKKVKEK